MHKIRDKAFVCYLTGSGCFWDDESGIDELLPVPSWASNQGEYIQKGREWSLQIGISHDDEKWCQENDLKKFLVESFLYLDHFMTWGHAAFSVQMEAKSTFLSLDARTTGLLAALKIELIINPPSGA